jgi:hypothetical protein
MAAGLLGVAAFFSGGYFSISMLPLGKYVLGKDDRSPEMMQFYEMFKELTGLGDKAIVDFLFTLSWARSFCVSDFSSAACSRNWCSLRCWRGTTTASNRRATERI